MAQLEAGRYEQLNTVLHTLQEAVLAVNQSEQIIAINPAMQRILGLVRAPRLGELLASVTTDLSLRETLEGGQPEHGAVLRLQGRDWIANRTPIYEGGHTTGAALTLYDAVAVFYKNLLEARNLIACCGGSVWRNDKLLISYFYLASNWRNEWLSAFVLGGNHVTSHDVRTALDVRSAAVKLKYNLLVSVGCNLYDVVVAFFPNGCGAANLGQVSLALWIAYFKELFYAVKALCGIICEHGTRTVLRVE